MRRPLILIIGTGQRHYREYLLSSISTVYRVHLFVTGEPTWEREYITGCTVLPSTLDAGALLAAARELAAHALIDGVLCWDEARILPAAEVACALGLPGGDPDAVRRCRDKHMTRESLAAAGVSQPASALVGSLEEALAAAAAIGYPVVLKPRALAASLGVVKVSSAAELGERFAFASETTVPEAPSYEKEVLVEEFAEGEEISVDCAVHHGDVLPLFVARKEIGFPPYFEEVGHYVDGNDPLLADSRIRELLARTHAALGFTDGITHCEVRLTATDPKVIEVNARLGGDMIPYLGLRATGIDPGLVAAAVACGRAPSVSRRRTLVGAVRFCYPARTVADLDGAALAFPPEIDRFETLLGPHHLSLFPAGTVPGRIAYVTAVAGSAKQCRRALDLVTDALDVLPHAPVRAPEPVARTRSRPRFAVIVDPMSTGAEYPAAFRAVGVEPVAVLSTADMSEACAAGWHPESFEHVHVADRMSIGQLAAKLDAYEPVCVVPGSETGVELADALAEAVLPGSGNPVALGPARRDKWAMAEAVRRAGVPHLRQHAGDDPDAVARWLAENELEHAPLVLKPTRSAGTDDVHLVSPGGSWRPVFDHILGRVNKLGIRNHAVLVSEVAEGVELLVDSYSVGGRHGLVDVCRYDKARRRGRIGIYERVDFLAPDDADVEAVWGYTRQVLDAVGIRNGCGHAEIMLTAAGPRLIEVGARPAGGGHQMITMLATGDNHIERTVRHRVLGEFRPGYELRSFLSGAFISSPAAGIWRNAEVFAGVEALPTFHAKHFPVGTGDEVAATEDIFTFLAWVILAGPDKAELDADYAKLKEMERQIRITPVAPSRSRPRLRPVPSCAGPGREAARSDTTPRRSSR